VRDAASCYRAGYQHAVYATRYGMFGGVAGLAGYFQAAIDTAAGLANNTFHRN
jgi:hypothetical protein